MSIATSSMIKWAAAAALVTGVAATSVGCGGIGPGDYIIYRVAQTSADQSSGCYGGTVPPDEKYDSSTFRATGTFIIYAGAEDKFYLDDGKDTLEGTLDGDTYTFTGKKTDVNFSGANDSTKITDSETLTITVTVDGSTVTGQAVDKVSEKCSGTGCPAAPPSCTVTIEFVGTEVDDVELKHDV